MPRLEQNKKERLKGGNMKNIKIGDKVRILEKDLIFAAFDGFFVTDAGKCVFLASDLKNKNTYGRFSQEFLEKNGYKVSE